MASGMEIPIEERAADEIRIAPDDPAYNPAFDVTPGRLITGIITDTGAAAAVRRRRPPASKPARAFSSREILRFSDKSPKIDGLVVIEGTDSSWRSERSTCCSTA